MKYGYARCSTNEDKQDIDRQRYIKTEAYMKDHPQGFSQFVS